MDIEDDGAMHGREQNKSEPTAVTEPFDGVASGEGIITVATANETTALDPAILKRPRAVRPRGSFPESDTRVASRVFRKDASLIYE